MAIITINTSTATAYVSTLSIGSSIGYRISGGGILGPKPYMQTTFTLNGDIIPFTSINSQTRILSVVEGEPVGRFEAYVGASGLRKTITLTNLGNSDMLVNAPVFSNRFTTAEPRYFKLMSPPWNISSGSSRTFLLSYRGLEEGTFYESIFFQTPNATLPYYRHDTQVVSRSGYNYSISPLGFSTSTWRYAENTVTNYVVTPRFLGQIDTDHVTPMTTNLVAGPGWTYDQISANLIGLRFSSRGLSNNTATYVATLTVTVPGESFTVISTVTHYVNTLYNYNSSTWYSQLSRPDAIVGMRVDRIQTAPGSTASDRILTIGVGSGADGAPYLKDITDDHLFDVANLAPMESTAKVKFAYWRTVYQIPLIGTATSRTYYSNDYRVKTQEPQSHDYDYYYGTGLSRYSMFTVIEDNEGDVNVILNEVREISGDSLVDGTLDRLERIFYYFDQLDQDAGFRTNPQLGERLNEFGVIDTANGTNTHKFLGFDKFDRIKLSLVKLL